MTITNVQESTSYFDKPVLRITIAPTIVVGPYLLRDLTTATEALLLSPTLHEPVHQMTTLVTECTEEVSARQLATCPNSQAGAEVLAAGEALGPTAQWMGENDLRQESDEVMDLHRRLPFLWSKKITTMITEDQVLDLEAEEV